MSGLVNIEYSKIPYKLNTLEGLITLLTFANIFNPIGIKLCITLQAFFKRIFILCFYKTHVLM